MYAFESYNFNGFAKSEISFLILTGYLSASFFGIFVSSAVANLNEKYTCVTLTCLLILSNICTLGTNINILLIGRVFYGCSLQVFLILLEQFNSTLNENHDFLHASVRFLYSCCLTVCYIITPLFLNMSPYVLGFIDSFSKLTKFNENEDQDSDGQEIALLIMKNDKARYDSTKYSPYSLLYFISVLLCFINLILLCKKKNNSIFEMKPISVLSSFTNIFEELFKGYLNILSTKYSLLVFITDILFGYLILLLSFSWRPLLETILSENNKSSMYSFGFCLIFCFMFGNMFYMINMIQPNQQKLIGFNKKLSAFTCMVLLFNIIKPNELLMFICLLLLSFMISFWFSFQSKVKNIHFDETAITSSACCRLPQFMLITFSLIYGNFEDSFSILLLLFGLTVGGSLLMNLTHHYKETDKLTNSF